MRLIAAEAETIAEGAGAGAGADIRSRRSAAAGSSAAALVSLGTAGLVQRRAAQVPVEGIGRAAGRILLARTGDLGAQDRDGLREQAVVGDLVGGPAGEVLLQRPQHLGGQRVRTGGQPDPAVTQWHRRRMQDPQGASNHRAGPVRRVCGGHCGCGQPDHRLPVQRPGAHQLSPGPSGSGM